MAVVICSGCGAKAGTPWAADDGSAEEEALSRGFRRSNGLWFCPGYPDCTGNYTEEGV